MAEVTALTSAQIDAVSWDTHSNVRSVPVGSEAEWWDSIDVNNVFGAVQGFLVGNMLQLNVNAALEDKDSIIAGDTDANLFFVDASTDRIGIGHNTPLEKVAIQNGNLFIHGTNSDPGPGIRNQFDTTAQSFWLNAVSDDVFAMGGIGGTPPTSGAIEVHSGNLNVGIGISPTNSNAKLNVDQIGTAAAIPVLNLIQADVSEEFMRFQGTAAAANLTQSIVDEGDVTTATRAGFVKVHVIDDGNQITDQDYFMPLFTLA